MLCDGKLIDSYIYRNKSENYVLYILYVVYRTQQRLRVKKHAKQYPVIPSGGPIGHQISKIRNSSEIQHYSAEITFQTGLLLEI